MAISSMIGLMSMRLHHVQILCPRGDEAAARAFYGDLLGLKEIPRPQTLAPGVVWFRFDDGRHLHIGEMRQSDAPTRNRAHFALQVDDLNAIRSRLQSAGIRWDDAAEIPGWNRVRIADPFGNQIEILQIMPEAAEDAVA